jgi:hypothetical protein
MSHGHHTYADRPHPEYVVLDIGGECGALILHTDPEMHGVEVEISPRGRDDDRSHKEALECGEYTLWTHGEPRARGVWVEAGGIAEIDWRAQSVAA